ncbi:MAG: NAD-dependent epimerase/dehydratase family protein [Actinomycetota bacterium]|nr:NAD-dependent epimerase/dehydratase family protein [Actinomycetota bacterium]
MSQAALLDGHGDVPRTVEALDDLLSTPDAALVADLAAVDGDIVIIGAGGKMGPTLSRMAKRAAARAGSARKVIAVSRFGGADNSQRQLLLDAGVETLSLDLLDPRAVERLPDAPNVIYMLGRKFGTTGAEPLTWAVNTYLPGVVASRYAGARIVAFSTGNVYPLTKVGAGAPDESHSVAPVGEYAWSCLGRERVFADAAQRLGAQVLLYRLNYAVEPRYGVLTEIGSAVWEGTPVDVTTAEVNVIWQRDANAYALRALRHCASPAAVLNASGPETASVRWLADEFGSRFDREPVFAGRESDSALLTNAGRAHAAFGYPRVPVLRALEWTAQWIGAQGARLDKPTHFQEQQGRF